MKALCGTIPTCIPLVSSPPSAPSFTLCPDGPTKALLEELQGVWVGVCNADGDRPTPPKAPLAVQITCYV
jgi:hypothetical protein